MRALVVVVIASAVGCYSPSYRDCEVMCASGTCPADLTCVAGVCRAPGASGECSAIMPDAPDGSLTIEQLFDAQLTAICEHSVRCGMFEDMPTCKDVFGGSISGYGDLVDAVKAGKVNYDPVKAAECLDGIANRSCDRWNTLGNRPLPAACHETLMGITAGGASCLFSEECVSQACTKTCQSACCAGTCTGNTAPRPRNNGESCTGTDYCVTGYCEPTALSCVPYKADGMTCAGDNECLNGFSCRTVGAMRICRALSPTGGPCSASSECAKLSDVCRSGACVTGGLTAAGCQLNTECQLMHWCNTGMCALPPTLNQSCMSSGFCRDGYCDNAMPTMLMCRAKRVDGQPCSPSMGGYECESGFCDGGTLTCATENCY